MKKLIFILLTNLSLTLPASAWTVPITIENNASALKSLEILNMYISVDDKTWSSAIPVDLFADSTGGQPSHKTVDVPHQPGGPCNLFLAFTFNNHPELVWPNKIGQPIFNICRDHIIAVSFPGNTAGPTVPLVLTFE